VARRRQALAAEAEEKAASQGGQAERSGEFSIASTVTSTIGKATSLIAAPLSLITGASGEAGGAGAVWPFVGETFEKMADAVRVEREKIAAQAAAAAEDGKKGPSAAVRSRGVRRTAPEEEDRVRWVVVVGVHQAQAQRVASRLMRQGVKRVAVIRGDGFGSAEKKGSG